MSSSWTGHHQPSPEQVLALAPPRPKPPTPHVHLAGGSGMAHPPGSRSGIRPVFRASSSLGSSASPTVTSPGITMSARNSCSMVVIPNEGAAPEIGAAPQCSGLMQFSQFLRKLRNSRS